MVRSLKIFGNTLTAMVAVGVLLAPAGQAGQLDIGANPALLKGHGTSMFFSIAGTGGGQALGLCTTAAFQATVQQGEGATQQPNELTLAPSFTQSTPTNCFLSDKEGGGEAHVRMNGCKFTLTGAEQEANEFLVDITGCEAGKQMQIVGVNCTVDIPEQNGLSHVVASNLEGGAVKFNMTLGNVTATQTGAACIDGDNHHSTNLTIKSASTTVEATKDESLQPGINVGAKPAVVTGTNESVHTLTFKSTAEANSGSLECSTASLEATASSLQNEWLLMTPTFTGCKYQVFQNATVTMNGCKFTFTTTAGAHPIDTATVDITACTFGKSITIQSISCQFVIPEQTGLSHAVGTNLSEGTHAFTLAFTLAGIKHTQIGPNCPAGNNHQLTNATLSGNTVVRAYQDQIGEQIIAHGHQYTRYKEGGEVGATYPRVPTKVTVSST